MISFRYLNKKKKTQNTNNQIYKPIKIKFFKPFLTIIQLSEYLTLSNFESSIYLTTLPKSHKVDAKTNTRTTQKQ